MKLTYRPLDINDCDQFIDLLTERPYLFNGHYDPDWHKAILERAPKWFKDPLYFFPGGFLTTMYSNEGVKVFKLTDQEIFDEMEIRRKLNRFYLSYRVFDENSQSLKNTGMSDRIFAWMGRNNYRVSRYKFYTDCTVEAGQTANYSYQRELLANKVWPFKTAIRIGFLIE